MSGTRDFNNIETRAVIKFFFVFLQDKASKDIHTIVTETLACFLPGRANEMYCLYSFCIALFMYIYSHFFCLYWCKDYCHRVTTEL